MIVRDPHASTKEAVEQLIPFMPDIRRCHTVFSQLERQWTWIALTGKINCNAIAATLFDFIFKTRDTFGLLRQDMTSMLGEKLLEKAVREMSPVAQVVMDIIKRNLYERTADVSFLATDGEIVGFLQSGACDVPTLRARLAAYHTKYSVYRDILVLDPQGRVCVQLDTKRPVSVSNDPLVRQTLGAPEFVETFRPTDLAPDGRSALVYSHAIRAEGVAEPLGVLCLVFDMDGETADLFAGMARFAQDMVILLLDEKGQAFASSDTRMVSIGRSFARTPEDSFAVTSHASKATLAVSRPSEGYQGYEGQAWQTHVLRNAQSAFASKAAEGIDVALVRREAGFSAQLTSIEEQAGDVMGDLTLAALNGQIMAARQSGNAREDERHAAQALPPILDAVRKMGIEMEHEFHYFTDGLLKTVTASRLNDASFLASITVEIMDRNLYERANDCRWWALTPDFRRILAQPSISRGDLSRLEDILEYINSYYTVYSNLFLYDARGTVVACSQAGERGLYGQQIGEEYVRRTLSLKDSDDFSVSPFRATELYHPKGAAQPTYVYSAPVFAPQGGQAVGGIGIVFDSLPQVADMLGDTLPKNGDGAVITGAASFFAEAGGILVAASEAHMHPGENCQLQPQWMALGQGECTSQLESVDGVLYAVGCARSRGYREYKRDGRYVNDVLCVVRLPI